MKIHVPFTLYFSDKNLYDKPPDLLFLVIFISFYISRYHFSQIFRTSFNIWQKDFCHKFSFFNRFTQTTTPSPPSLPPSVRKGVPAPLLFYGTHPLNQLAPFFKSLFPLPLFLFHPLLSYFTQLAPPSCNPLLP